MEQKIKKCEKVCNNIISITQKGIVEEKDISWHCEKCFKAGFV